MNIRLDWKKYTKAAVDVSAEGMVMLENNGCLPLWCKTSDLIVLHLFCTCMSYAIRDELAAG